LLPLFAAFLSSPCQERRIIGISFFPSTVSFKNF
jgi:hypothetical protein